MPRPGRVLTWLGVATALATLATSIVYLRDIGRAYERIRGRSTVVPSPYGDIEFTDRGSGRPVLIVHGSGGGFDQGELFADVLLSEDVRRIVPSRFGYLRSTFLPGATFDDQAHAYAWLLDHLGIDRVAVLAVSHGGPSALLFAVLHPDRVSSLTLISAGVASSDDPEQAQANRQGDALTRIYQHDVLYWVLTKTVRRTFMSLMGANAQVSAGLTSDQRALVDAVIDGMNPVAPRAAGVRFDNQAAMPNTRIAGVRAPTLIVHATDDTLQRYHNADFAAATIAGAQLVTFERGGHLVMVVEQAAIRARVAAHMAGAATPIIPATR